MAKPKTSITEIQIHLFEHAGLALQYVADQVEALRRAPPPAAPVLGGRAAASALLHALPAAQLLLMWRVFLDGFSTSTPAFWAGAACWGLFTAAALVRWARGGFGADGGAFSAGSGVHIQRALAAAGGGLTHYVPQVGCNSAWLACVKVASKVCLRIRHHTDLCGRRPQSSSRCSVLVPAQLDCFASF